MNRKLDLSSVEFSKKDEYFNIRLPGKLTTNLAYETGVHIGDGCLSLIKSRLFCYRICYSGSWLNELTYFNEILVPLIRKLYNKKTIVTKGVTNECRIEFGSKAISQFKSKVLGLPIGQKGEISIPTMILENKKLAMSCLKGIADTDFSLAFIRKHKDFNYCPKVKGDSESKPLMMQIEGLVRKYLHVNPVVLYDIKRYDKRTGKLSINNMIELNGKKCLDIWMKNVGFENTHSITKFLVWKRLGYVPKMSASDRIEMLETVSPDSSSGR